MTGSISQSVQQSTSDTHIAGSTVVFPLARAEIPPLRLVRLGSPQAVPVGMSATGEAHAI